jgi:DNA modification methylase
VPGAGAGGGKERGEQIGFTSIRNSLVKDLKPKDLIGIPWRVAFALQADGWWLRQDIIWHKPNPMPESVTDRCTKAHEYIFLLSKSERYYYDHEAIKEESTYKWNSAKSFSSGGLRALYGVDTAGGSQWNGTGTHENIEKEGRNKRSVWTVATKPYAEAHFATYPTKLIEPCILAGCPVGGTVFDPFTGSGTTALVALTNNRTFIGTELNPDYITIAQRRLSSIQPRLFD